MSQDHYRKLERMYASARINRYFEPTLEVSEGKAVLTIPVRQDFYHSAGAIHGSVYFKAMDDSAFFAANSLVPDVFVLTSSFTTYILRPVTAGVLTATGTVVNRSKSLLLAESVVTDSEGKVVARGSGTFMPSRIALTAEIGYA